MKVEQIPADELIVMTDEMHRIFSAGGCIPMCHGCGKPLSAGREFKLSTIEKDNWPTSQYPGGYVERMLDMWKGKVKSFLRLDEEIKLETREVMLCDKCTPESYRQAVISGLEKRLREYNPDGGCFRVNGKIVH